MPHNYTYHPRLWVLKLRFEDLEMRQKMTKSEVPRRRAAVAQSVAPRRSATAALRAQRYAREAVLGKEVLEEMAKSSRERLEKRP